MTLILAYIELFIRGERPGWSKCPGGMSGYRCHLYKCYHDDILLIFRYRSVGGKRIISE